MDLDQLLHRIWTTMDGQRSGQGPSFIEVPDGFTLDEVTEVLKQRVGRRRHLVTEGDVAPWLAERNGEPLVDAMNIFGPLPHTLLGWDLHARWIGCAELTENGPLIITVTDRTGPSVSEVPSGASWAQKLAFLTGWDHEPASDEPVDWTAAEEALGTRLPNDYKETVDLLGPGSFDLYVDVISPDDTAHGLLEWAKLDARHAESLWDPHPAFPAPGGLLRWGGSEQEFEFVWQTGAADPDEWPVMVRDLRKWDRYDFGFGEFLVRMLTDRQLGWPPSHLGAHTFIHFNGC